MRHFRDIAKWTLYTYSNSKGEKSLGEQVTSTNADSTLLGSAACKAMYYATKKCMW